MGFLDLSPSKDVQTFEIKAAEKPKKKQPSYNFFTDIYPNTLKLEGGYTIDSGGPTFKGVTQKTYDFYRGSQGLPLRDVKLSEGNEISDLYYKEYFKKPGYDRLSKPLAGVMFDFGVNAGNQRAIKYLQQEVGAVPDGKLGPQTQKKIEEYIAKNGEASLGHAVMQLRSMHNQNLIQKLPQRYGKYEQGWKNRLETIRKTYLDVLDEINPFSVKEAAAEEIEKKTETAKKGFLQFLSEDVPSPYGVGEFKKDIPQGFTSEDLARLPVEAIREPFFEPRITKTMKDVFSIALVALLGKEILKQFMDFRSVSATVKSYEKFEQKFNEKWDKVLDYALEKTGGFFTIGQSYVMNDLKAAAWNKEYYFWNLRRNIISSKYEVFAGLPVKFEDGYIEPSRIEKLLSSTKQTNWPVKQLLSFLFNKVPQVEIDTLLKPLLEGKDSITKDETIQGIRQNTPVVQEVVKTTNKISSKEKREILEQYFNDTGDRISWEEYVDAHGGEGSIGGQTKFSQYQLPGGENYREVLIKTPDEGTTIAIRAEKMFGKKLKDLTTSELEQVRDADQKIEKSQFKSSHWDEPNVLAHLRMNDRTTPDGKKVLFIEELQSDWARNLRELGPKKDVSPQALEEYWKTHGKIGEEKSHGQYIAYTQDNPGDTWLGRAGGNTPEEAKANALNVIKRRIEGNDAGVPSHSLLKSWQELALKRAVKEAVDGGYDYISWTTGKQQAERYDLSKQIDYLAWSTDENGNIGVMGSKNGETVVEYPSTEPSRLSNVIGKDAAQKILDDGGKRGILEEKDLKIGGEWAKNLYDKQVPNILRNLTKGEIVKLDLSNKEASEAHKKKIRLLNRKLNRLALKRYDITTFDMLSTGHQEEILEDEGLTRSDIEIPKGKSSKIQPAFKITPQVKAYVIGAPTKDEVNNITSQITSTPAGKDEINKGFNSEKEFEEFLSEFITDVNSSGRMYSKEYLKISQISKQLKERGFIDYRGTEVKDASDVAQVATAFRHPLVEHLQAIFIKDGKVISHQVITSGCPVWVQNKDWDKYKKNIGDLYKRLQYDSFYIAHNHPNGVATFSESDSNFAKWLYRNFSNFKGSIVTNGKWGHQFRLKEDGRLISKIFQNFKEPISFQPANFPRVNPDISANIAKKFVTKDQVAVIFKNDDREVVAIEVMGNKKNIAQAILDRARQYKVVHCDILKPDKTPLNLEFFPMLLDSEGNPAGWGATKIYTYSSDRTRRRPLKDVTDTYRYPNPGTYRPRVSFFKSDTHFGVQQQEPQLFLPAPKPDKIRGFIETVKGAEKTTPEVKAAIDSRYTPITNKETMTEAQLLVETNPNEAYQIAMSDEKPTARSNAIALALIDRAQLSGNWEEAKILVEKTAQRNTSLGQAIQALAMYERLTPEGILRYAESTFRRARESLPKETLTKWERLVKDLTSEKDKEALAKELKIPYMSEEVMKRLYDRAVKIQGMEPGRDKSIEVALLMKDISREIPKSIWKKISLIQTMSMLLNPKTIIRNILGNTGFSVMENISETVGMVLDSAVSVMTGKRTQYLPNLQTQFKGFGKGFEESLQETILGIDLGAQGTKFDLPQNSVFDTGVLSGLEKTLNLVLRVPDRAAYQAAFNESIYQQMKAEGVEEPTLEMIEKAHYEGLYRTFQDDSVLSRAFVGLKKSLNVTKDWGLGDMVIKFPKTPANILSRGIEYSPLGFTRTVYELGRATLGKGFNQEKFVKETARAFTGTALLVGAGALLAKLGIISGKENKDREARDFLRVQGIGDYQINVSALKRFIMSGMDPETTKLKPGDEFVSYDWFQPNSIGIAMGANLATSNKQSLVEQIMDAANTLVEQPLMTGIRTATTEGAIKGFSRMIQDVPATFIPTLLNQVKQLTDNISRNTRDPNYLKATTNKIIYRMPGISKILPENIGPFGQPKEIYAGGTNNPFNVFMNPAFVSKYNPTSEAKMVIDIWKETGETIHFPKVTPSQVMIDGKSRKLTPDEQRAFASYIGNKTGVLYNILANDRIFMAQPPDTKAKRLQGFLTDIYTSAKIEILGYKPKHVSTNILGIIRDIANWWKRDAYRREKNSFLPERRKGFLALIPQ